MKESLAARSNNSHSVCDLMQVKQLKSEGYNRYLTVAWQISCKLTKNLLHSFRSSTLASQSVLVDLTKVSSVHKNTHSSLYWQYLDTETSSLNPVGEHYFKVVVRVMSSLSTEGMVWVCNWYYQWLAPLAKSISQLTLACLLYRECFRP